jgi:sterol desaturase/sphingolipid hydroxylase (fatty acid hydroxylase superfamily)
MAPDPSLDGAQRRFNAAMERYERVPTYQAIGKAVSVANVSLQLLTLILVWPASLGAPLQLAAFAAAWVLADFLNGLVHIFMDGNDAYDSPVGPLIAAFHLHHMTPLYKRRPLPLVYFEESGSKLWLVGYLALVALVIRAGAVPPLAAWILVHVGILSSVAEVSHYCCHTVDSGWVRLLRSAGLLLSKRHHARHHREDNVNYAFLNGLTDPLLNVVARRWSRGYKRTTDLHYGRYEGGGTSNR